MFLGSLKEDRDSLLQEVSRAKDSYSLLRIQGKLHYLDSKLSALELLQTEEKDEQSRSSTTGY